ncbi:hypothetical protein JRO89_XS14G0020700 [Xanthoceras sorbifolium]|uniref:K Homology domain-containing protein n=1 Tax=Xanthoceras sorbifolium TaxID=99658 RepID=A0ABQ8H3F0_9ROSI|nr:hypothetical protein JRO89_XS14G0020700 [Xanthoceras sorbifolium]
MESTESSYVSSPEAPRKRSPAPHKSSASDTTEKPTYIRFLVSNSLAGAVIGKGGSTITEFQSQSGARIQLSRNHEFFPGTTDRIIMISGTIDETLKAVELILDKLLSELHNEDGDDVGQKTKVRLIVPNSSCGSIIGKGGAIIKSFIEDSQAGIKISPVDHNYYGLNDRLVTLTGSLDEQMRAIELIISKLTEEAHYSQTVNIPFSYAVGLLTSDQGKAFNCFYHGIIDFPCCIEKDVIDILENLADPAVFNVAVFYTSYKVQRCLSVYFTGFHGIPYAHVHPSVPTVAHSGMNYGPNATGRKYQNNKEDRTNSVTIGVADEHIGLVVGRGGRNIMEISQVSGARIKVSDRGDFMSGTTDRKVTISGSQRAIRSAESMIMQKVAYASERPMD